MRHLLGIALASLLLAVTLGAWLWFDSSGADGPVNEVLGAAQTPIPTSAPTATPKAWQPARLLPLTPVPVTYRTLDPSFAALPAAWAFSGTYAGGAYQIEVPDRWNGDVVYYAHGFRGNPPELTVSVPALRQYFIDRGYAWAASSYTRNGYEPGIAARDTLALKSVFEQQVGKPRFSYIYGESMGGNVVTFSLEQYPHEYDGGLTECGVVTGPQILEYFASWAALAQYFSGVPFADGALTPTELDAIFSSQVVPALGSPAAPTDAGRQFTDVVMRLTGGERPFFNEGLAHQFSSNFTIIAHAVELAGAASGAAQNENTAYIVSDGASVSTDQLNREIARLAPSPAYRNAAAFPEFQPMTGRIERPLLTLHGTGDLFVPISLEQSYREIVHTAGRDGLLVQRAVRRSGHCNFSEEERERAFDDLTAWVETGERPEGEDLTGDLSNAGLPFTTPLEPSDPSLLP